jgi:hypothetical protein
MKKNTSLFLAAFAVAFVCAWQSGVSAAPWSRRFHAAFCVTSSDTELTTQDSPEELEGIKATGSDIQLYCPVADDTAMNVRDATALTVYAVGGGAAAIPCSSTSTGASVACGTTVKPPSFGAPIDIKTPWKNVGLNSHRFPYVYVSGGTHLVLRAYSVAGNGP